VVFNKHVILALALIAYTTLFIATFDRFYDSVMISSIALIGLCGWFYDPRVGMLLIIPYILLNTAILFIVSGRPCDILLTYNPLGIILAMIVVIAAGRLKKSDDELESLQSSLESRVAEATTELDNLARQLIENDEQERILIGQDLHDGVGQYLTCMLLHCEALSLSLRKEERSEAGLAEWMTRRIQNNIQTVRQLSRSLLPIHLTETSLATALEEMTAYFNDVSPAILSLKCSGNGLNIPVPAAQHLHRITHEAIYRTIFKYKATHVDIKLTTRNHDCRIQINGNGIPRNLLPFSDLVSEVMKYRIRAIGGTQTLTDTTKGGFRLKCSIDFKKVIG